MTIEVEKLILKEIDNDYELKYSEKVAYLAYKEIWKFILFARQYNFNSISIDFKCNMIEDIYSINKSDGIYFNINRLDNADVNLKWNTYYDDCSKYCINNILNTNINIRLLFKLLRDDGFYINYLNDDNPMLVHLEISKYAIEKSIKSVFLKNKILKLEM